MTALLAPLSLPYRLGLLADRFIKSRSAVRLPRPTISVGNLTWGGTGKTPLVIKLLSDLKNWGHKPAVLTRGYGGEGVLSDEPALIADYHPDVPVAVGAQRATNAQRLLKAGGVDAFVLDDGFQHWRLKRDLDIVCIDATDPWGGGHLIPWGRLREPICSLKRAGLVVLTRGELVTEGTRREIIERIAAHTEAPVLTSYFQTVYFDWKSGKTVIASDLKGRAVIALSAIGRPSSFEEALSMTEARVTPLRFRDHHNYGEEDLKRIEETARAQSAGIVTTEKDLVKLRRTRWGSAPELPFNVIVAQIHHRFSNDDETIWRNAIMSVMKEIRA